MISISESCADEISPLLKMKYNGSDVNLDLISLILIESNFLVSTESGPTESIIA